MRFRSEMLHNSPKNLAIIGKILLNDPPEDRGYES